MRAIAFITLLFLSTLVPWYALAVFAIAYALMWSAYELFFIAIAIDTYFGVTVLVPYYTLATFCILISLEWVKPRLLVYTV